MFGRGTGRVIFAATLLAVAGSINIIFGIAAISDSKFFTDSTKYVFESLNTWGWVTLLLGVLQILAGSSLMRGGAFGRAFAIAAATLGAIGALLAAAGPNPFWSLAVFALCVIVIHGVVVYGEPEPNRPV